jgi:hypothetical protein
MMTNDTTRLCGEIVALRNGRGALMDGLVRDHKDRNQSVFQFCAHTRSARAETAKRTKTERLSFLHNLKRAVNAQRREMRRDLAGARRAWAGAGA